MRAFSLALILANIFFFGWSRLRSGESDAEQPVTNVGLRLLLASEMASLPKSTIIPAASKSAANDTGSTKPPRPQPVVDSSCHSIGPFTELTEAARASVALHATGLEPRQRIAQGEFWVGYWVNIPNLGARENAERALGKVQSRGISDAYILSTATANAISVGVFSDYSSAQARVEELRQLGFQPEILDRKRTEPQYWIDVDLVSPDQSIDDVLVQMDPGKINRIENRACPTAPAPAEASG